MRYITAFAMVLLFAPATLQAQSSAKIIEERVIWDLERYNRQTDLVVFDGRLFCAFCESYQSYMAKAHLRVISSRDSVVWRSAAHIESPSPSRGSRDPRLVITSTNRLRLIAATSIPGQLMRPVAWQSKDGYKWVKKYLQPPGFRLSSVQYHRGTGYGFAYGCICGSAQTVQILAGKKGKRFQPHFKRTFVGFFPRRGSLIFDGDQGYCLLSRGGSGNNRQQGYLGRSQAPFQTWNWHQLVTAFSHPNLIRLKDGRMLAAVGLYQGGKRMALCEFDPQTGNLRELLQIPTRGSQQHVGLAEYKGHIWISFHVSASAKRERIRIAKVKLNP